MQGSPTYYKYCLAPSCHNTSVKTPQKIFIRLPCNKTTRTKWLRACGRDPKEISSSSRGYVCEDHFNLEEDMKSYLKFTMVGGNMKMKPDVVPHIFDCPPSRDPGSSQIPGAASYSTVACRKTAKAKNIPFLPPDLIETVKCEYAANTLAQDVSFSHQDIKPEYIKMEDLQDLSCAVNSEIKVEVLVPVASSGASVKEKICRSLTPPHSQSDDI